MSFPRLEKPTAINAQSTPCTRSPNIRKEKNPRPLKEEDVTTENNLATEDKPNLFSEKKPKLQRKSPSDCNATSARPEDVSSSAEPRVSFSWILNKSERTEQERETHFINDQSDI